MVSSSRRAAGVRVEMLWQPATAELQRNTSAAAAAWLNKHTALPMQPAAPAATKMGSIAFCCCTHRSPARTSAVSRSATPPPPTASAASRAPLAAAWPAPLSPTTLAGQCGAPPLDPASSGQPGRTIACRMRTLTHQLLAPRHLWQHPSPCQPPRLRLSQSQQSPSQQLQEPRPRRPLPLQLLPAAAAAASRAPSKRWPPRLALHKLQVLWQQVRPHRFRRSSWLLQATATSWLVSLCCQLVAMCASCCTTTLGHMQLPAEPSQCEAALGRACIHARYSAHAPFSTHTLPLALARHLLLPPARTQLTKSAQATCPQWPAWGP